MKSWNSLLACMMSDDPLGLQRHACVTAVLEYVLTWLCLDHFPGRLLGTTGRRVNPTGNHAFGSEYAPGLIEHTCDRTAWLGSNRAHGPPGPVAA